VTNCGKFGVATNSISQVQFCSQLYLNPDFVLNERYASLTENAIGKDNQSSSQENNQ